MLGFEVRMAEKFQKVATGKLVGGWSEVGKGNPWVFSFQTLLKQEADPGTAEDAA